MSINRKVERSGAAFWVVRWREGGKQRSRAFDRKRDAEAFETEVRRRKRLGELDLINAGTETLDAFAREWWAVYAEPNLAPKTKQVYAGESPRVWWRLDFLAPVAPGRVFVWRV